MEVLLDQVTTMPILLGAALALIGGMITQFIFLRVSLSHTKKALLSAFRAELRIIRDNMGASLGGYRKSLELGELPAPTVFAIPTPVFDANAGQLGQLRDIDFVEHIVEVYNSVQSLAEQAKVYKVTASSEISQQDLNSIHLYATVTHVQVMKLHNRLTKVSPNGKINLDETEVESRKLSAEHAALLDAGQINRILNKRWGDA
jgi:hypothetical protein